MARVGPDTSNFFKLYLNFESYGGYYYPSPYIDAFSHLHMVGPGVVDYGWLGIMPVSVGANKNLANTLGRWTKSKYGYRSTYSHRKE